ncbi:hypothetical protein GCM10008957_46050 [Deinococcus ruber]|uniref:Uncharacterized protein n=1 Tax=Deinococcus ruber TaxID=1848197 RepID=A0A918CM50_9DEIO|nr:hypothetical protein GCM10008957_46050 [Deinococcus ruber]
MLYFPATGGERTCRTAQSGTKDETLTSGKWRKPLPAADLPPRQMVLSPTLRRTGLAKL